MLPWLLFLVFESMVHAQSLNKTLLDSLFNNLDRHNKIMGSIAISRNGNLVYTRSIGYDLVDEKKKIPSTEKSKYRIGSISKMFTATLILQLVDEGKLDLSATLDRYYPAVPNAGKISISDLLKHRSGIHSFTNDSSYLTWMTEPRTRDEMIRIIAAGKPEFEPGSRAEYSNSNYVLLGYIIEDICNKLYSKVLDEKITSRIGLEDTYYGGKTRIRNHEAHSYVFNKNWQQQPETDMSIPHGAGAIVSNPNDLTRFIEALFTCKLISKESLDKMITITDGFGMGIMQLPFYTKIAYVHGGSIDGFSSMLGYMPKDSLAVAFCSNGQQYSVNEVIIGALSIYFNVPYSIPDFKTIVVVPEDLDQYLGTYASQQLPFKISITKEDGILKAQATGQPSFPLEPVAVHKFRFDRAGVEIEFKPENKSMVIRQGGQEYLYSREQ
jgi:CubicO group peptidase (beta-lactamase class C family)